MPVAGVLAASPELLDEACAALGECLGPTDLTSEAVRWTTSSYYAREMGAEIWRRYLSFARLGRADGLAEIKLLSNELERRWRGERGRRANLDPGYVDLVRLVLASTKDAAHRIYLGRGIYAEATLRFERGRFRPWPWTYPDYAEDRTLDFFTRVRARLLEHCRDRAGTRARDDG